MPKSQNRAKLGFSVMVSLSKKEEKETPNMLD
jgi:hypothetical protein